MALRWDDGDRDPHTAIFTGVMDYQPNVDGVMWFANHCWPETRRQFPEARMLIVGSRPSAKVRGLHGRNGIEVTGRVPEVPPYHDRAAVAVAPLRLARGDGDALTPHSAVGSPSTPSVRGMQRLFRDGPVADMRFRAKLRPAVLLR